MLYIQQEPNQPRQPSKILAATKKMFFAVIPTNFWQLGIWAFIILCVTLR